MAALGKGLKGTGTELFKRTEPTPPETTSFKSEKMSSQESTKTISHKSTDVRKAVVLSTELDERLRRYCFEHRTKEVRVFREALEQFLERKGC